MIDHLARTENVVGLKRGRRVGDVDLVVDAEFVAGAGRGAGNLGGEPAVIAARHRMRLVQQQIDALRGRRPQPKQRAVPRQPWAELPLIHAEPAKASTERGGALVSAPDAKSAAACLSSAVLST